MMTGHASFPREFFVLAAFIAAALVAPRSLRAVDYPPELADVPETFKSLEWREIVENRDLLIKAYGITEDDMPAFLHVYYTAWAASYEHHRQLSQIANIMDSEEVAAAKLDAFMAGLPTSRSALMALTESILPTRNFSESRHRFAELLEHATALRLRGQDQRMASTEFLRAIQSNRAHLTASATERGHPIPDRVLRRLGLRNKNRPRAIGELLDSPETLAKPGIVVKEPEGVFTRPLHRGKPLVKTVNLPAHPPEPMTAIPPMVDPLEDTAWRHLKSLAAEAAVAAGPERAKTIEAMLTEARGRIDATRRAHEFEYRALADLTSRGEFNRRLAELDRCLAGIMQEFEARFAAVK